jgi:hypothetical protein
MASTPSPKIRRRYETASNPTMLERDVREHKLFMA